MVTEWLIAVRELGLLALLVGMGVWLARWIPTWVDQFAVSREKPCNSRQRSGKRTG